jgi:hypothetical protein
MGKWKYTCSSKHSKRWALVEVNSQFHVLDALHLGKQPPVATWHHSQTGRGGEDTQVPCLDANLVFMQCSRFLQPRLWRYKPCICSGLIL